MKAPSLTSFRCVWVVDGYFLFARFQEIEHLIPGKSDRITADSRTYESAGFYEAQDSIPVNAEKLRDLINRFRQFAVGPGVHCYYLIPDNLSKIASRPPAETAGRFQLSKAIVKDRTSCQGQ
jgi:hypothetical protein